MTESEIATNDRSICDNEVVALPCESLANVGVAGTAQPDKNVALTESATGTLENLDYA
jgi:hypothetical protein